MDFIKCGSPNGQSKVSTSLINVIRSSKYTSGQMQDNGLVVVVCVFVCVCLLSALDFALRNSLASLKHCSQEKNTSCIPVGRDTQPSSLFTVKVLFVICS